MTKGLIIIIALLALALLAGCGVDDPAFLQETETDAMNDVELSDDWDCTSDCCSECWEDEPVDTGMTTAQEQAVMSAESYLEFSDFSRAGLIGQLKYEGFSTKVAEFAVDYLDVDWKKQAVLCAEAYMEIGGFSRQSLLDQLLYEEYTRAQAEYAVDKVY